MRKYNDIEKISIDLNQSLNESRLVSSGVDVQKSLRQTVNRALKIVFRLFQRLSNNMESESEYFTPDFYRKLLNDHSIFDPAKLLDIAAIYGQSNHRQVRQLIEGIFEIEPRLLAEIKDSFDMMLNIMKKIFKDALRTDQMIQGDAILQKTRSEQDEVIMVLIENIVEMLGNFSLLVHHFND